MGEEQLARATAGERYVCDPPVVLEYQRRRMQAPALQRPREPFGFNFRDWGVDFFDLDEWSSFLLLQRAQTLEAGHDRRVDIYMLDHLSAADADPSRLDRYVVRGVRGAAASFLKNPPEREKVVKAEHDQAHLLAFLNLRMKPPHQGAPHGPALDKPPEGQEPAEHIGDVGEEDELAAMVGEHPDAVKEVIRLLGGGEGHRKAGREACSDDDDDPKLRPFIFEETLRTIWDEDEVASALGVHRLGGSKYVYRKEPKEQLGTLVNVANAVVKATCTAHRDCKAFFQLGCLERDIGAAYAAGLKFLYHSTLSDRKSHQEFSTMVRDAYRERQV